MLIDYQFMHAVKMLISLIAAAILFRHYFMFKLDCHSFSQLECQFMLAVGMLFCLFFVLLICLTLVVTLLFVYTRGGACCGAAAVRNGRQVKSPFPAA